MTLIDLIVQFAQAHPLAAAIITLIAFFEAPALTIAAVLAVLLLS